MLPAGATVSTQAAKDLKKSGQPIVQPAEVKDNASNGMLVAQDESGEDAIQEEQTGGEPDTASAAHEGSQLRPLGGADQHPSDESGQPSDGPSNIEQGPSIGPSDGPEQPGDEPSNAEQEPSIDPSDGPGQPSHGLSADATRTSIDISQYVGPDESIFKPIVREDDNKSGSTEDLLKQRGRRREAGADSGPEWTENQRLARCLAVGLAAGLVFALAQFLITRDTVNTLYMSIPLGRSDNLTTAVTYGIASGVVLGFGMGALLVRFQKGPGLGFVLGALVGLSLGNSFWGLLPGIIVGVINGRVATLGVRRVINV
jgi:hypothetical protein